MKNLIYSVYRGETSMMELFTGPSKKEDKINKKYKVSVIIPCFNAGKFLKQTLDSVLSQTYESLEIIAIDDGSTDDTREILNHYTSIKVLSHPNNQNLGQAKSLNIGILNAEGDYIAFLDADDLWEPTKIEKQINIFKKNKNVGLVYTNGNAIDEYGQNLYSLFTSTFLENNSPDRILVNCYISAGQSTVMVKKKLLYDVGLYDEVLQSQDHDMWIKLNELTEFFYISEKLMFYRKHEDQISHRRKQWEDGFIILKNARKRYPYSYNVIRKRYAVLFFRLGVFDYKNKQYIKAMKNLFCSFLFDPVRSISDFNKVQMIFK